MATRLSTAEILAAARAADGRRSASSHAASESTSTATLERPPAAIVETPPARDSAPEPAARPVSDEVRLAGEPAAPPSVATILRKVQVEREQGTLEPTFAPPSMAAILADVRRAAGVADAAGPAVTPSISRLLATIRGNSRAATTAAAEVAPPSAQTIAPSNERAQPKQRSRTAEILAAARAQGAGRPGTTTSTPSASGRSRTADILAAARKQGAANANGAATGTSRPTQRPTQASDRKPTEQSGAPEAPTTSPVPNDGLPRPKSVASILDAIRKESRATEVELPSLAAMIATLRQADLAADPVPRRGESGIDWKARLRRWFGLASETHRGASI